MQFKTFQKKSLISYAYVNQIKKAYDILTSIQNVTQFQMLFGKHAAPSSFIFRRENTMFQKKIIHNFIEFS